MTLVMIDGNPITRETHALHRRVERATKSLMMFPAETVDWLAAGDGLVSLLLAGGNGAMLTLRSLAMADAIRAEIAPQLASLRAQQALIDAI